MLDHPLWHAMQLQLALLVRLWLLPPCAGLKRLPEVQEGVNWGAPAVLWAAGVAHVKRTWGCWWSF